MPDLRSIARFHQSAHLDKIITVDGNEVWAKCLLADREEETDFLRNTLVSFDAKEVQRQIVVRWDPAHLPGQTVVDEGDTLTVESVQEIGRRQYMILTCSIRTPSRQEALV